MANSFLTIDMITREAQRILHETAAFLGTINRQFDGSWSGEGKTGDTLRIRLPSEYVRTKNTRVADVQDAEEQSVSLVRATQDHVAMRFNSREMALDLNSFSENHLKPAMSVLVSGIESDVLQGVTKEVYNVAGTAGTAPADLAAAGAARAKLNQYLAPKDNNRFIQMDSVTMGTLVNGLKLQVNPARDISSQYREGLMLRMAMADFYENERVWTMTNVTSAAITSGTMDGPQLVNGLATITTATFCTPTAGMVFTIAGVFACHPETKQAYSHLQQFTTVTSVSASTVTISPTIYITGARKNVCDSAGADLTTSSIVTSAALVTLGAASTSYVQNLMYHKNAFAFATGALPIMGDAAKCVVKTLDGLSLRVWQASDIRNDELITRVDILYGYKTIRPQLACRITS